MLRTNERGRSVRASPPATSPDPAIISVQSRQLGSSESVDPFAGIGGGGMRIQLRPTLHHIGADPYGLAGGAVAGDVVEGHESVSFALEFYRVRGQAVNPPPIGSQKRIGT